jgi:toxin CcdB
MAQFDVFENPIVASRGAYPFVVAMQSDVARDSVDQIVAPLAIRRSMPGVAGRVSPIVEIGGDEHVVLISSLASIRSRDLRVHRYSLRSARTELLAAIDYLFFGI